ncbi:Cobalt-zinc-cadmium resistance protein CzcA [Labilithrix luteola]|uniref:Cobalt-zinc-cadmium resistance protein CzcA n=1 Tax=Labilithrix luteola TaxID=1391654 RepID=A0A0K1PKU3_9BACT|nr:CusA/CzcA family heavy metal efflux RND transporter [Labilithrix luteola]AKU94021.1 Cobalt-zinc-cadmium resistance protein CzcA [Labilithrix luteola]
MIHALVALAVRHRGLVIFATLLFALIGARSYLALPIDAVPDITNVQVQVLTAAPGLSPLEVESMVTRPVELAMAGLPHTTQVRSASRAGVSAVTVIFDDDQPLFEARALVSQRLPAARAAVLGGAEPELGPMSTGLGEVFHFTVSWPGHTAAEIRTLLDWEIAYALRTVPGVVEVNAWGGDTRQIEVRLRPLDLVAHSLTPKDVEMRLLEGGASGGGGAIERGGEQAIVRLDGQYRTVDSVAAQVVAIKHGGTPVLVKDVADVRDGVAFRLSAATADGKGETVYAMVQMIAGGNAHEIVAKVDERLREIRTRLPTGAVIEPFYDRATLVDRVLATVKHSLLEGGVVVIIVLLLLLGDVAAGIVVATTIPLAMLGAFALMRVFDVTGNLMSLGAIDFGLVVDGAVVVVEGALASMAVHRIVAKDALEREAAAVGKPIAFGVFIVGLVYVPILMLEAVEGKMFRPMAMTVLFALGTALVLTFTWVPALASLLLRRIHEHEPWLVRKMRKVYEPLLERSLARPSFAIVVAIVLVAVGVVAGWGRGIEFVPRLEEGDLVVQVTRPPSVSLAEAIQGTTAVEAALREFPEVRTVVSRTGSPDVATDIMGVEQSDVFVILVPRSEWVTAHDREELVAKFDERLRRALPGTGFSWTQPIEMRTQELLGGSKSDVGIKIFGDDLATLRRIAQAVVHELGTIEGAADVRVEQTAGLPLATVRPDPWKAARAGASVEDVRAAVESVREGRHVGTLVEGERRFEVRTRSSLASGDGLDRMPVVLEGGRSALLSDIADVVDEEGPAIVSREQARRRVLVEANVRGRDLGSFVAELERKLAKVERPSGYYVQVSGQYEHLVHAAKRFAVIVPLTIAVIFALLYMSFGSAKPALVILLNVPVATSGGLLALWARSLPISIAAAVGMIALFGVATLNGTVLLSAARAHEKEGRSALEAARLAARERFRPVLTTAFVASVGFVPMALATGTGAEVQRPLATVVIGGLVTATVLTLGLLPALYARIEGGSARDHARES